MKKIIYLLFFTTTFCFSQSIKATYIKKYIKANNEKAGIIEEINDVAPSIFTYSFSKNKSIFKMIETATKKDSIKTNIVDGVTVSEETYLPTYDEIYKDLSKKIFLREYKIYDIDFSIKDMLLNYKWKITNEVSEIKGFKCKKAISNIEKFEIVAWFCEEIPINDGPDRFSGLPGLILKIDLGHFSTITIDKIKLIKEQLEINIPKNKSAYLNLKEFKKKEYETYQKKINED